MDYVAIVTSLLILQVVFFSIHAGQMRGKHDVKAPSMDGPDEFLRATRVHQNTIEQFIAVLPAMWMFAYLVSAPVAAGLGLVFLIGRFMYRAAYLKDPSKRAPGFVAGFLAIVLLTLGSIGGAVWNLL